MEDHEPELATNDEWRGIMVRRRKELGLSQEDLRLRLGVSQALVSKIETGEVGSSKLVLPLCRILNIPPPEHFVDEVDKAWTRAGRVLRHHSLERARRMLEIVESMIREEEARAGEREHDDADLPRKP